jgi:molybdopterin molybdotransferase
VSGTRWALARELAHAAAVPLPVETVPLPDAVGRTLARPLVAATALPPFDTAAMDGFAVSGGGPWRVVGQVLAGHGDPGRLHAGEAVEIATGAPVPASCDAVLRYEDAVRDGGGRVDGPLAHPGTHLRRTGEDIPPGQPLAPAGTRIGGVLAALAASVGLDEVVARQPVRVAAFITGDEIVYRGRPGHGRVRDAIGPQLPPLIAREGAGLELRLPVPDHPPRELASAVRAAVAEVIVVCGATSCGPADRLPAVLRELAAVPVVDGVACRPGHPQSLWTLPDGRYVVGVPGNPYAALVACHTLLVPLLAGLAGRPLPGLPLAPIAGGFAGRPSAELTRIVPVSWVGAEVMPTGHDGPASLWGAARADALAAVPPGWSGEPVPLVGL